MRRFFAFFIFTVSAIHFHAQETCIQDRLIEQCRQSETYYQTKQFSSAFRSSSDLLLNSPQLTGAVKEELRFIQASSAQRMNHIDANALLKAFINDYPLSTNLSRAYLYLGELQTNEKQYAIAAETLQNCDVNTFSDSDADDYCFSMAQAKLNTGNLASADTLFTILIGRNRDYVPEATYYLAYIAYSNGNYSQALQGFEKAKKFNVFKQSSNLFILNIFFNQARYDDVLNMAAHLKDENNLDDAGQTELLRLQGAASYELSDYHSAKLFYKDYIRLAADLKSPDAYRYGMLLFMDKDFEHAVDYLSQATMNDDAIAQNATYHLGVCYLQLHNEDMARMSFERASLANHDMRAKENALFNYALICYKTSFSPFNEQVKAFERILDEFPDSQYADRVNAYLSDAFLSSKNYEAAITFIDKVKKPSAQLLKTRAKLLFLLGVNNFDNGNYNDALSHFSSSIKQSVSLKEEALETYFWRGETYYRLNETDKAKADFSHFLNSKQSESLKAWPMAHYSMGYCCFNTNDYQKALDWFLKYIDIKSIQGSDTYPDALNRIGDCFFYMRNYASASEFYLKTDQLTPTGNDYAAYQLAFCLGLQKNYKEKTTVLNSLIQRFPSSQYVDDAFYEEGQAFIALEMNGQAIACFNNLSEQFPNSPLSRKALIQTGLLYYQMGQYYKAIASYKQVIANYPGSSEATTALNDLKSIHVAINDVQGYIDYVASLGNGQTVEASQQDSLLYMAAERLMVDKKDNDATQAFKHYLQKYPHGHFAAEANYYCGSLLHELGFAEESANYFEAVVGIPGNPYICPSLAVMSEDSYKSENYAKALELYSHLAKLANERETRINAKAGVMRCLYHLGQTESLCTAAEELMLETNLSPELLREAHYDKAMSLIQLGRTDEAMNDLEILSEDSQTAYGAEARYTMAQYFFDKGQTEKSTSLAQSFLHDGTPHAYWLARTFLLLADIYLSEGDVFQAKQYLLSLKENYKADDDIEERIESRLQKITQTMAQ